MIGRHDDDIKLIQGWLCIFIRNHNHQQYHHNPRHWWLSSCFPWSRQLCRRGQLAGFSWNQSSLCLPFSCSLALILCLRFLSAASLFNRSGVPLAIILEKAPIAALHCSGWPWDSSQPGTFSSSLLLFYFFALRHGFQSTDRICSLLTNRN